MFVLVLRRPFVSFWSSPSGVPEPERLVEAQTSNFRKTGFLQGWAFTWKGEIL